MTSPALHPDSRPDSDPDRDAATATARAIVAGVEQVVHGRPAQVRIVIQAVLAGGHVLVEDIPGNGKTTLARAVAAVLGGDFRRIQGTSDLLPADITGSGSWDGRPGGGQPVFTPGPLFGHVVLVDELNRTPPRTQSAFMEAMDEGAVTVDGVTHALPDPFVVLATQNPIEQHGTYPLPEGQLDRFAVALELGLNDPSVERWVVREQLGHATVLDLRPVTTPAEVAAARAQSRATHVSEGVLDYALRIIEATRRDPQIELGASTRAAVVLVRCAQAGALLDGRGFVTPDDVSLIAGTVLGHRLVLTNGGGLAAGRGIVGRLLQTVSVPLL